MDTRCLRAPSHSCLKESARLISEYHHWISGVGFPTTSQYSSKVSPVCLVSENGDFTKPASGGGGGLGRSVSRAAELVLAAFSNGPCRSTLQKGHVRDTGLRVAHFRSNE
ncbi:hypothetical protein EYF80_007616 [Liparis tanakae]|uniref:Uncharacterized protein n=1 Tax=Liparis tanakae TaxID=230148 RepID=A0A4Z2IVJ3_9TELE|nr:hypothetical protein EYF80_007616 [Liparis tanakae]